MRKTSSDDAHSSKKGPDTWVRTANCWRDGWPAVGHDWQMWLFRSSSPDLMATIKSLSLFWGATSDKARHFAQRKSDFQNASHSQITFRPGSHHVSQEWASLRPPREKHQGKWRTQRLARGSLHSSPGLHMAIGPEWPSRRNGQTRRGHTCLATTTSSESCHAPIRGQTPHSKSSQHARHSSIQPASLKQHVKLDSDMGISWNRGWGTSAWCWRDRSWTPWLYWSGATLPTLLRGSQSLRANQFLTSLTKLVNFWPTWPTFDQRLTNFWQTWPTFEQLLANLTWQQTTNSEANWIE